MGRLLLISGCVIANALCVSDIALRGVTGFGLAERAALFIINGRAGCWPWSPKEVPYRDGMTICPGQEVTLTIIVPLRRLPPLAPPALDLPEGGRI